MAVLNKVAVGCKGMRHWGMVSRREVACVDDRFGRSVHCATGRSIDRNNSCARLRARVTRARATPSFDSPVPAMKFPSILEISEMLAPFEMAIEAAQAGVRVYFLDSGREFGRFSGPGAFLDAWGEHVATVIHESEKISFVQEIYTSSSAEARIELLELVRAHVLHASPELKSRLLKLERVPAETLAPDWPSRYAKIRSGPRWAKNFELGLIDCFVALDPALVPWAKGLRREMEEWLGLDSELD